MTNDDIMANIFIYGRVCNFVMKIRIRDGLVDSHPKALISTFYGQII